MTIITFRDVVVNGARFTRESHARQAADRLHDFVASYGLETACVVTVQSTNYVGFVARKPFATGLQVMVRYILGKEGRIVATPNSDEPEAVREALVWL